MPNQKINLLIMQDDKEFSNFLSAKLAACKTYNIYTANDINSALSVCNNFVIKVIIIDLDIKNLQYNIKLFEKIRDLFFDIEFIIITENKDMSTDLDCFEKSISSFLKKPIIIEELRKKIDRVVDNSFVKNINREFFTKNSKMIEILNVVDKAAKTDINVLLTGETGTGKEILAKRLHLQSKRAYKKFVAINCAAIPETMLEATLFGYERGAFTGAIKSMPGKFEQANGGTLFLDEIAELPYHLEAKLLRVLQENEIERLGSRKTIKLDLRIISATNKNLQEEINKGKFREDLYFRLSVFPINILPLRDRVEDIIYISSNLLSYYSKKFDVPEPILDKPAEDYLMKYHWPGNIRELENVIQRAIVNQQAGIIRVEDIKFPDQVVLTKINENHSFNNFEDIILMLNKFRGSRKRTADYFGVSTRGLRYKIHKMKTLGMDIPEKTDFKGD